MPNHTRLESVSSSALLDAGAHQGSAAARQSSQSKGGAQARGRLAQAGPLRRFGRGACLGLATACLASLAWFAASSSAQAEPASGSATKNTTGKQSGQALSLPVETFQLDNGLTVILSQDRSSPVVAVELRYLVGSAHEAKGKSGFAHLFEHLMFQGSKNFNDEYFAPFEPIGGVINGTTNTDRTNYFERVPSQYLELALWMESDRMFNLLPALSQEKLDNQRDVVKNERRQRYENTPYGMLRFYLSEAMYPSGHPYRHLTIGSHQDLTNASLQDVKDFFNQYYTPANAVLTLVGDFEVAEARRLAQRYFGRKIKGERAATPKAPPVQLKGIKHEKHTDAVALPKVHIAWPTPALYADGDAALDVLASVLTYGKSSRLYKPLVFEKKLAKEVNAYQASSQLGSIFVVEATAAEGQDVDALAKELLTALKSALASPPSKDELTRALNAWEKSYYERAESVLNRAIMLSTYYHIAGDANYFSKDLERYTGLTPEAISSVYRFIDLENYVRVDITPGAKPAVSDTMGGG